MAWENLRRSLAVKTLIILSCFTLPLLTACEPEEEPLEPPPMSSMVMDFDSFPSENSTTQVEQLRLAPESIYFSHTNSLTNHQFATLKVFFWSTLIAVGQAVPIHVFQTALNHLPEKQDDGSWVWKYSTTFQNVKYSARLVGKVVAETVEWEMYVSKEGEFTDFKWYTGVSQIDRSGGSWVLYEDPTAPKAIFTITWGRDSSASTAFLKYLNTKEGINNGEYIQYAKIANTNGYDAQFSIYLINDLDTTLSHTEMVEWNIATRAGRVQDPNHYGDNTWYYWDESLADTVAP